MEKEFQDQITQFQLLEQQMQQYVLQKQTLQVQLVEIDHALEELQHTTEKPFKIVGNVMVACDKQTLTQDLQTKKETCEIRLKNVDTQESQTKQTLEKLHTTLLQQIESKNQKRGG